MEKLFQSSFPGRFIQKEIWLFDWLGSCGTDGTRHSFNSLKFEPQVSLDCSIFCSHQTKLTQIFDCSWERKGETTCIDLFVVTLGLFELLKWDFGTKHSDSKSCLSVLLSVWWYVFCFNDAVIKILTILSVKVLLLWHHGSFIIVLKICPVWVWFSSFDFHLKQYAFTSYQLWQKKQGKYDTRKEHRPLKQHHSTFHSCVQQNSFWWLNIMFQI